MKNRIVYLDYLRVFATFAVIILHVAASNWYSIDVSSLEWKTLHVYRSMVRWGVPVFVMISGSLFLGRGYDIKKIYSKNILRLFTAFFVWSAIYALFEGGDMLDVLTGHYHMWFIPMMGWLYICIPMIKKLVESKEVMKYFLWIAFFFSFLFPQIVQLVNDFGGEKMVQTIDVLDNIFVLSNFYYVAYFVGGYYLSNLELDRKNRHVIYVMGVAGCLFIIMADIALSMRTQTPIETYGGNFSIPVLLQSVAVFVWMKYHVTDTNKSSAVMHKLAQYSFGAYLVHALVIEMLEALLGLNTLSFHPVLAVPVIGVIVFAVSFLVSAVIHRVPVLSRYIV